MQQDQTYSSTEVLKETGAAYWKLDFLVRSHKVSALRQGRGRERRFNKSEFDKAKRLLTEDAELQDA